PSTALGLTFDGSSPTEISRLALTSVSATADGFSPAPPYTVDASASVTYPIIASSSLQVAPLTPGFLTFDAPALPSVSGALDAISLSSVPASPATPAPPYVVDAPASDANAAIVSSSQAEPLSAGVLTFDQPALPSVSSTLLGVINLTSSESESVSATPLINSAPNLTLGNVRPQTHNFAPPQESLVLSNGWRLPKDLRTVRNLKLNIHINGGDFFNLLTFCPLLEKLDMTLFSNDGIPASVVSDSLTDLSVTTSVDTKPLLEVIRAPNLKSLHLEWDRANNLDRMPNDPDIGLLGLLQSSRCSLRTLSLLDMFPDEVQLIDCLKHQCLSRLQSLIVRNPNYLTSQVDFRGRVIDESTLSALSQSNGTGPLCPDLVRLELTPCFAPDGKLASMMEARGRRTQSTFALSYSMGSSGSMYLKDKSKLQSLCGRHPNWMIIEEGCRTEYP
ncbi:hypothetical protein H0H93_004103, partial [Arthromyces matolae]